MSRREVIVTILVLLAVTVAGFIFGRVILPRFIMRIMDMNLESSSAEIQNRGTWFYSQKYEQGAKYWVSFRGWGCRCSSPI